MARRVNVGRDFDLDAHVQKPKSVWKTEAKTKQILVFLALIVLMVSLAISSAIGLCDGSFNELSTVWNTVSWLIALLFGHYFRPSS